MCQSVNKVCNLCKMEKFIQTITILDHDVNLCDECLEIAIKYTDSIMRKNDISNVAREYIQYVNK